MNFKLGHYPGQVLFGGHVFPTRKAAESAWYDTCPGRNDQKTIQRTEGTHEK